MCTGSCYKYKYREKVQRELWNGWHRGIHIQNSCINGWIGEKNSGVVTFMFIENVRKSKESLSCDAV